MPRTLIAIALSVVTAATVVHTQDKLDYAMFSKIRDEGLNRSQALDHVSWLADVYGPRLQGSPAMRQAAEWVAKTVGAWGMANVHQEKWPFGKGWSLVRYSANMVEPQVQPLIGVPRSWTPGTAGAVVADVVRVDIRNDADFEKYRGKLAGKIVLTQPVREVKLLEGIVVQRWNDALLKEAMTSPIPAARGRRAVARARAEPRRQDPEVLPRRARRRRVRSRQRRVARRGRQPDVVAHAAHRRRHRVPERRRPARHRECRQRGAGGHAGGRALQPDAPDPRQGHSREGRARHQDAVSRRDRRQRLQRLRRSARQRPRERVRHARRASGRRRHRYRRHRQRRRRRGDDGSDADPQSRRRQAAPHDSPRAVGRRGRRTARVQGLRAGAPCRSEDDGGQARAPEDLGVLQPR